MDIADKAQALEQAQRDKAIAITTSHAQTAGRSTCEDCGVGIPEARRKANPNATRCIVCQSEFEACQRHQIGNR